VIKRKSWMLFLQMPREPGGAGAPGKPGENSTQTASPDQAPVSAISGSKAIGVAPAFRDRARRLSRLPRSGASVGPAPIIRLGPAPIIRLGPARVGTGVGPHVGGSARVVARRRCVAHPVGRPGAAATPRRCPQERIRFLDVPQTIYQVHRELELSRRCAGEVILQQVEPHEIVPSNTPVLQLSSP
jgi:hypothetical protein